MEYDSGHHIDDYTQEYRIFGKGGEVYWVADYTHIRRDPSGKITHYEGIVLDITERKRVEEALQKSEHRSAMLLQAIPDMMFIISREGVYRDLRVPDESDLAIPADKIIGTNVRDSGFGKESTDAILHHIALALETKELQLFEYDLTLPKGIREYEARLLALNADEVLGIVRDITDRKHAEEAVQATVKLNQLIDTMSVKESIGYTLDEAERLTNSKIGFFHLINPDEQTIQLVVWSTETKKHCFIPKEPEMHYPVDKAGVWVDALRYRKPVIHNDYASLPHKKGLPEGHVPVIRELVVPIFDETKIVAIVGVGNKATDYDEKDINVVTLLAKNAWTLIQRKRAEEDLQRSIERFRMVMDSIDALVYVVDMKTYELLFINKYGKDIWGGDIEGKVCWQTIQSGQAGPCPFCTNDRLVDEKGNPNGIYNWEFRNTVNGHWYDCRDSAIRWFDGRIVRLEIATDITGRKQIEEELRESRQLFADIISFLPDPTFVIDKDGTVLAWNRAIEKMSGVPAREMIGRGDYEYSLWQYGKKRPLLIDLVLHPDQDTGRMNYTDILWEGSTVTAQTVIIRPGSNRETPVSLVASPLINSQGMVTGAIESMRDITHLKETEAELARINQNLEQIVRDRTRALEDEVAQRIRAEKNVQAALDYTRSVIEANPDLMVVLDGEGNILDINAAGELLTGIPKVQLIGTPYFGYLVEDGTIYSAFAGLLEKGTIENFVRIRHTDGHVTPLSVHATVITGRDGGKVQIIVSAHDITRQKQDEEAIRASLDEKILLLREIHHRVKNNLQIIISLTNLQMRTLDDPRMKQVMAETQNRVRAMSLVHERLYQSENLSSINLADYTRFLANQLFSFYGTDHGNVALHADIGDIQLDINTAIPLGLILNELISNALKHAFPNGRRGTISISGHSDGGILTLVIEDDGMGLPPGFDWKNTESLGLRLVNSLVDQLGGTIERRAGTGTAFIITIPGKPK